MRTVSSVHCALKCTLHCIMLFVQVSVCTNMYTVLECATHTGCSLQCATKLQCAPKLECNIYLSLVLFSSPPLMSVSARFCLFPSVSVHFYPFGDCFFLYWCYYPPTSRDSVSPVLGIVKVIYVSQHYIKRIYTLVQLTLKQKPE